jgi:hypothetical protein
MFLIKIYINLGVFDTSIIMHKNNKIQLLIVISALSTVIVTNGIQYQQEQYIAFVKHHHLKHQ